MTTITNISININTLKISVHAKRDRWDRITSCVQAVGIGEPMLIIDSPKTKYTNEKVVEILTSTGMMFIVNVDKNMLITAYLCPIGTAIAMYRSRGYNRIPCNLYCTLCHNTKCYQHLYNFY